MDWSLASKHQLPFFFFIIHNKGGSVRNRAERGRDDAVFTLSSSRKKGFQLWTKPKSQTPNPRTPNPPFLISSHIFFSYPSNSSSSSSSHQVRLTSQLQPQPPINESLFTIPTELISTRRALWLSFLAPFRCGISSKATVVVGVFRVGLKWWVKPCRLHFPFG